MHRTVFQIFSNKYDKKLDRKIKMTEKESIKDQFLFKSYKGFKSMDLFVMKQKLPRGLNRKGQKNASDR